MKIRLDENISYRVAAALKAMVANRQGFECSWVGDHALPKTGDPAWIKQFAEDDGDAVISGDCNIIQNWPNLIAYTESGLISFFPEAQFNGFTAYGKAALIIRWWPTLVEKIKQSQKGDRWRIPFIWTPDITRFKDPRLDTDDKKREAGIEPTAKVYPLRPQSGGK